MPRAVNSALAQLRAGDRVCVVDDACDVRVDPGQFGSAVHVLSLPEHSGVGAARNAGAAWASTDLVAFLDDDDVYVDGALDTLRALFGDDGTECALAYGRRRHVDEHGHFIEEDDFGPVDAVGRTASAQERVLIAHSASSCGWVFQRQVFLALDGFDPALYVSEDRDLIYRLMQTESRIVGLPDICIEYLRNASALSSNDNPVPKLASDARLLNKHAEWFRQYPDVAALHLNRVASRQRKLGDRDAALETLKLLCSIQPTNIRAWRRRLTW